MKNITTYYARRTNLFTWLSALSVLVAAVARIAFFAGVDGNVGFKVAVFRIILPLAANLFFIIQLLAEGGKRLFLTRGPVVLCAIMQITIVLDLAKYGMPYVLTAACLVLIVLQTTLFCLTMRGLIHTVFPALLSYLAFAIIGAADVTFRKSFLSYLENRLDYVLADCCIWLGIVFLLLATRRMPDYREGDPYRLKVGDRREGRLVRSLQPMNKVAPYIMVTRNTASNLISDSVEIAAIERYVRNKRREGYKHFGILHVLLAAYVRAASELPGLNRFLAGHKAYQRFDIVANMVVKKEMGVDCPETAIKVHFAKGDTAVQVYEKFDAKVQEAKEAPLDSGFDNLAGLLNAIPGLFLNLTVVILRLLDYFGALPDKLEELSPFHGSMFITSMGSLGIPPIFHHLYDFGTVTQFCSFGAKRSEKILLDDGTVQTKKYLDFTWVTDERTVDGFYYAAALKLIKSYLLHPERLDEPYEVIEDIE